MSLKKRIVFMLLATFVAIQFFQAPKDNKGPETAADVSRVLPMSDDVRAILKRSCYDCHSNSTKYPWYSYVQPFGWWLSSHINEGKEELNLSEFTRRKNSKLKAMAESIKEGSMPLPSYTLMHGSAKLSDQERKILLDWINAAGANLN